MTESTRLAIEISRIRQQLRTLRHPLVREKANRRLHELTAALNVIREAAPVD